MAMEVANEVTRRPWYGQRPVMEPWLVTGAGKVITLKDQEWCRVGMIDLVDASFMCAVSVGIKGIPTIKVEINFNVGGLVDQLAEHHNLMNYGAFLVGFKQGVNYYVTELEAGIEERRIAFLN